jgi:hypothetical protein
LQCIGVVVYTWAPYFETIVVLGAIVSVIECVTRQLVGASRPLTASSSKNKGSIVGVSVVGVSVVGTCVK